MTRSTFYGKSADKTEAMIVPSGRKSRSLSSSFPDFRTVGCASVPLSDSFKNLGVTLDCHLTMKTHVSILIRSANFEIRHSSSIRHLFTDGTKALVSACVPSRLDYCSSLLFGCPQYLLDQLQRVQNNATRLALRASKTDHFSPHLASLHWLPIDSRIQYKLSALCYNYLSSTAPDYLTELLRIYKPTRQLRLSSDTPFSVFPKYAHTRLVKAHSFSYDAPAVWYALPYEIRSANTFLSFQSSLKTDLFQRSY